MSMYWGVSPPAKAAPRCAAGGVMATTAAAPLASFTGPAGRPGDPGPARSPSTALGSPAMPEASTELAYVALLFGLLVLPKVLQRFRIPAAITSLGLGLAFGEGFGLFRDDRTVHLLATFGIAALFLFAGLDVDGRSLRRGARTLVEHLIIRALTLVAGMFAVAALFPLGRRPAVLVALALLTPSTGFILDSLAAWGVSDEERFWIRTKAIATELLALAVLFVTLQSTSAGRLALSAVALIGMAAFLPFILRFLVARVTPYAPNSEFAFLLMVAVVFAYATRQLGVYYLVGAFLVGIMARGMRERLPRLASDQNLHAVEVFASFFIPFYFFNAGLEIPREALTWRALLIGVAFAAIVIPFRIVLLVGQRRLRMGEPVRQGLRVAVPLIPTLVFTLVLARILQEQFVIAPELYGSLVVYAVLTTLLPAVVLHAPRAGLAYEAQVLPEEATAVPVPAAAPGPAPADAPQPTMDEYHPVDERTPTDPLDADRLHA